jgi:DNA-binding SARP family transcriptional activator
MGNRRIDIAAVNAASQHALRALKSQQWSEAAKALDDLLAETGWVTGEDTELEADEQLRECYRNVARLDGPAREIKELIAARPVQGDAVTALLPSLAALVEDVKRAC